MNPLLTSTIFSILSLSVFAASVTHIRQDFVLDPRCNPFALQQCMNAANVCFAIDGSKSITNSQFTNATFFSRDVVTSLDTVSTLTGLRHRYAALQFTHDPYPITNGYSTDVLLFNDLMEQATQTHDRLSSRRRR